jgi:tetratricopeptide (TPR) repeat protein
MADGPAVRVPVRPAMSRLEQLEKLIALSPEDPLAHYALGLEYTNLERYEPAIAAFEQTLKVDAKYSAAYYHKARAEIKAGRRDAALSTLKLGLEVAASVGDQKTVAEMRLLRDTIT